MKTMKTPKTIKTDRKYVAWVDEVRGIMTEGHSLVIRLHRALRRGRDTKLWQRGDYQSFERCLYEEFGIAPQRWAHLERAVERFGENWVTKYGLEPSITMLRIPEGSDAETQIHHEVQEWEKSHARPPSAEVVGRIVSKYVAPQRPTRSQINEEDRLRDEVRRLQVELREEKRLHREAEKRARDLQKQVDRFTRKKAA